MAKIQRKLQKVFASNATNNGQFGSAQVGTKVTSTDLDTLQSLSAFLSGWNDATISGQKLPTLEEMQALHYITTTQIAYIFQEGIAEYQADTEYHEKSIVKKTGTYEIYGSLIDDNTGNALPSKASNANWQYLGNLNDQNTYSYEDTGTADTYELSVRGGFEDVTSYTDGMIVFFKAGNTNTGASTLEVASLGAKDLTDSAGVDLVAGAIESGSYCIASYDSENDRFELFSLGGVSFATNAEAQAGTIDNKAVTPDNLGNTVLGIGQTWTDVSASRSDGVTYTNTTGRPIFVSITNGAGQANPGGNLDVDGVKTAVNAIGSNTNGSLGVTCIVPDGSDYTYTSNTGDPFDLWMELR